MDARSPNPPGRRVRRSKADVVDAALGILDGQGLPDLTMRRLGETLGVRPSALYWHFDSKQALLAAVSGRILAPMQEAGPDEHTLPDAASELGGRLRDCLLTYRDGAELVSSSLALGLIEPPLHEQLGAVARRTGAPAGLAATGAEAVTHFVIGYAFHEQQRLHAETVGVLGAAESLTPEGAASPAESDGRGFRSVLSLIVAGLAASLENSAPH